MDADRTVSLDIDFEKLYYNMVGCRAEWLYNLKEWTGHSYRRKKKRVIQRIQKFNNSCKRKEDRKETIHAHAEAVKNTKNAAECLIR